MSEKDKLPPGSLCVVCGDTATGKHYSVPSCNGCKTFFRRALVNKRQFTCMGNGSCPVNRGVRCACRHCRLQKCLAVGMDKNSIQNDRDRIGYTKRTRKSDKLQHANGNGCDTWDWGHDGHGETGGQGHDRQRSPSYDHMDIKPNMNLIDPIVDRLTTLENNFSLLLSRGDIEPYATLEDGIASTSRFYSTINVKLTDPIAKPPVGSDQSKMPFWRSRIIALYIDWAKTFQCFRSLPSSDKVALITNDASSYLIMCEAFRTPEHIDPSQLHSYISGANTAASINGTMHGRYEARNGRTSNVQETMPEMISVVMNDNAARGFALVLDAKANVKREPGDAEMIRLPTEYGSLPADYGTWIPQDYGGPMAGTEGKPEMHTFFDPSYSALGRSSDTSDVRALLTAPTNYTTVGCLTPVMAMMIDYVMKPLRQLNVSTPEFALLQAIMFFDPDTDGLDAASQRNVAAEQKRMLTALHKHILRTYDGIHASERFSNILLRIPTIRKVAAKKNESLQMIDTLNLFALNSLVKEAALGIRPSNPNTPILGSKDQMMSSEGEYSVDSFYSGQMLRPEDHDHE